MIRCLIRQRICGDIASTLYIAYQVNWGLYSLCPLMSSYRCSASHVLFSLLPPQRRLHGSDGTGTATASWNDIIGIWKSMTSYIQLLWMVNALQITHLELPSPESLPFVPLLYGWLAWECLMPVSWTAGQRAMVKLMLQAVGLPLALLLGCLALWSVLYLLDTHSGGGEQAQVSKKARARLAIQAWRKRGYLAWVYNMATVMLPSLGSQRWGVPKSLAPVAEEAHAGSSGRSGAGAPRAISGWWQFIRFRMLVTILVMVHVMYPFIVTAMLEAVHCRMFVGRQDQEATATEWSLLQAWFDWPSRDVTSPTCNQTFEGMLWSQDHSMACFQGAHKWFGVLFGILGLVLFGIMLPAMGFLWFFLKFSWGCQNSERDRKLEDWGRGNQVGRPLAAHNAACQA